MSEPEIDIVANLEEYLSRHPYVEDGTELAEAIARIVAAKGRIKQLERAADYAFDVLWQRNVDHVSGMAERSVFDKLKAALKK